MSEQQQRFQQRKRQISYTDLEQENRRIRERVRLLEQERDGFKRLFESAQDASEAAEQREKAAEYRAERAEEKLAVLVEEIEERS